MRFSIITATKNNQETILKTLQSIKIQNYNDFELIIIDANSKDKTIELIKNFNLQNTSIKNQKGIGVYQAFNQGIKLSKGEIIIILNADDFFADNNTLRKLDTIFNEDKSVQFIISNVKILGKKNNLIRNYTVKNFIPFMFYFGHMPPHPGVFVKKEVYNKCELYSEEFENAGDFEFFLRIFIKNKFKYKKINQHFVSMTYGGKSNKNIKSFIKNTQEIKKALILNGLFSSYIFIMIRFLIKIFQFNVK
ncbi:glycosyltransferase [Candidatus Pelagibacter sp.]|nr:glycosyltransferase [Candidatus Pelagibacter sp.]